MNPSCASSLLHISYWEFFQQYFTPLLRELDLALKTMEAPISTAHAARVLVMRPETVEKIMKAEGLEQIDHEGFLRIAMNGKSSLCRLLQRECLCGSPERYSPEEIAYIYGLQEEHVKSVCSETGYRTVPAKELPEFLSQVYVYLMY